MTWRRLFTTLLLLHLPLVFVWWLAGGWIAFLVMFGLHWGVVLHSMHAGSSFFCPATRTFSTEKKEVCLTIDDGPTDDTPTVLDVLDRHGIRAIFFIIGQRAQARPDLLKLIHQRGHMIGNHTMHHRLATFWAHGPGAMKAEIEAVEQLVQAATGSRSRWFRAPAGVRNFLCGAVLTSIGLRYMGWAARGRDSLDDNLDALWQKMERDLSPGAIILTHQGRAHSVAWLERLIAEMKQRGWRFAAPQEHFGGNC